MSIARLLALSAATLILSAAAGFSETPVIRLAAQTSGTVNWELDTITHYGLDQANGFSLEVMDVAGSPAGQVAFQGGEVDAVVTDWLWVARQRAEGRDFVFIPYSKAVGALLVPKGSAAATLSDLAGGKIGIAGGPVDKSWIILRAYAQKAEGFDIAAGTEQVFGAPPLIFKSALDGEFAGAINFWHFAAKMEAAGMRPLVTVAEAAEALGLDPGTPLLGYVVRGEMLRDKPGLIDAFVAASRAAKEILASDDTAWDRLRPQMNAASDAEFEALRAGFREGIPAPGPVDEAAAARMLAVMAALGGAELVGEVKDMPAGVFLKPEG